MGVVVVVVGLLLLLLLLSLLLLVVVVKKMMMMFVCRCCRGAAVVVAVARKHARAHAHPHARTRTHARTHTPPRPLLHDARAHLRGPANLLRASQAGDGLVTAEEPPEKRVVEAESFVRARPRERRQLCGVLVQERAVPVWCCATSSAT